MWFIDMTRTVNNMKSASSLITISMIFSIFYHEISICSRYVSKLVFMTTGDDFSIKLVLDICLSNIFYRDARGSG